MIKLRSGSPNPSNSMYSHLWIAATFLLVGACTDTTPQISAERKAAAERYLHGIYECDSSVVDALAADSITISYPIIKTIFGTSALRGREAARNFADRFCTRWIDAEMTVNELVHEGQRVVMVWSFRAKNGIPGDDGSPPTFEETAWGGITLIRFNEQGKIVLEVGEESTPGPFSRLE